MTAPAASPAADDAPHAVLGLTPGALETGAAVGAAGLALTSTGSMVVAVVFLAVAARSRWTLTALLLAVAAVAARFTTVGFDDLAGIQSVLGPAGTFGPVTAAASAWLAATAAVLAVRAPADATNLQRVMVAIAGGALAAAIAVGPGPGGDLAPRIAATVVATVLAFVLTTADDRPAVARVRASLAVAAGVAAVVLAAWPA
ncbi:MAG: hypothetical protein OSA99_12940 [Acidimicrobiales bacterium]|nr:hypothetical protein [Acidimicrobiales bacterium]